MLSPKRLKFRKQHKGRIHGNAKGGTELSFGSFGLKALSPDRITARQIEAARRAITRQMKRAGRLWIRIFPDVPVSDKPIGLLQAARSPNFLWPKVKVPSNTGAQGFTRGVFCSNVKALTRKPLAKRLLSALLNCRSRPSLLNA